jgi:hypothetical protein
MDPQRLDPQTHAPCCERLLTPEALRAHGPAHPPPAPLHLPWTTIQSTRRDQSGAERRIPIEEAKEIDSPPPVWGTSCTPAAKGGAIFSLVCHVSPEMGRGLRCVWVLEWCRIIPISIVASI